MKRFFNAVLLLVLCLTLCSLTTMEAKASINNLVVSQNTTITNQTISGNVYVPRGYTLTLSGTVNVNGNVYVWGTLVNRSTLTVTGTLNCLHYNNVMSAGDYDSGYFYNYSSADIYALNVTGSWLSTPIPGVTNTATVPPTPVPTPKPTPTATRTTSPTIKPSITPSPTSTSSTDNTWKFSDGILTITKSGDMDDYSFSNQPWDNIKEAVTSIIIEEGVSRIGKCAFMGLPNLKSVSIPTTVSSIGIWAFQDCSSLDNVIIPRSVTEVESWAFGGCASLKTITIPSSVKSLGLAVFDESSNVTANIHYSNTYAVNYCKSNNVSYLESCNEQHSVCDISVNDFIDSTCTKEGEYKEIKTCMICGENVSTETKIINKKEHTTVIDAAIKPTCTSTGLTEGKHCSACKKVIDAQETVAMLPHTEVIDSAVNPTCTKTGLTQGKHCSVCKKVIDAQETVAMLPHTEVIDAAVDPTCTKTGLTEGKHCSVCQKVIVARKTVGKLPHDGVIDAAVPATHITTGLTEGKHCKNCGKILLAQNMIPLVNVSMVVTLPASLTIIKEQAFADNTFECVIIPDGCISIDAGAFEGNEVLKFVEIPASVKEIDGTAFKGCNENLIFITTAGSTAETYASEHSFYCVIK